MVYDKILINAQQLDQSVAAIAERLVREYASPDNLLAMVILEGARIFSDALFAKMPYPVPVEYLKISSYHGGTKSTGEVILHFPDTLCDQIRDKDILIIDDIYDTGLTLASLMEHVAKCKPRTVKTCILLEKQVPHTKNISIDFLGRYVENEFVIGYGLDYKNQYRELPFVATLRKELIR